MAAADAGIGAPELVALIVENGHSRIPVYEGNVDATVGIVHAKDLLPALSRGETSIALRQVARAPLFVPENKRVDDLLEEFRVANLPIAIVQDEYGGTAGLVTIEDLLEEIVGEIKDEYDVEEPMIRPIDKNAMLLDGRTPIADVNEALDIEVPDDDFETIGGFVFGLFGHQPAEGDKIRCDGMEFTVTRTDGRRIHEVRLALNPEDEDVEGVDAEASSFSG
jgi:putative hemolysin